MKNIFYTIVISISLFSYLLNAQWVQTNGPFGGPITSLAIFSNRNGDVNLMSEVNGRVIISTDSGINWDSVKAPFPSFTDIVQAGENIFAGTLNGVFLSTDDGSNWNAINSGLSDHNVYGLTASPGGKGGLNLYAGTFDGVFLSTNNGLNWFPFNNGLPKNPYDTTHYTSISSFGEIGTNLFAGTGDGVYILTNNGTGWVPVNNGLPKSRYDSTYYVSITCIEVIGTNLFVGTSDEGVFLSTDNGSSWVSVNNGLPKSPYYANYFSGINSFAVVGTNLIAGTYSGVFISTNKGTSWSEINSGLKNSYVYALTVIPNGDLFAATDRGLFGSTNSGENWTAVGFTNTNVSALAVYKNSSGGTNLLAGTEEFYSGGSVFLSKDEGMNWDEIYNPASSSFFGVECIAVAPGPGGTGGGNSIFAGVWGLNRSIDDGKTWTIVDSGLTYFYIKALITFPDGNGGINLLAGAHDYSGNGSVFLSTNNGDNWFPVDSGLTKSPVSSFALLHNNNGEINIFAGTWGSGVYLSTNNGKNWKAVNNGLPKNPADTTQYVSINSFAVIGTNLFVGTDYDGVFLSANSGVNWQKVSSGLPVNNYISSFAVSGTNLFAGTPEGVFLTTNNGASWNDVSKGLANTDVLSLTVSNSDLFAGTNGSGVWKRPLSELVTAVENGHNNIPNNFELKQNYPNPFNPSTNIDFAIPQSSFVNLKVYDILGREAATLVNEEKPAGNYQIEFNAANHPSGIYFYKLQAGSFTESKKMILLK